MEKHYEYKKGKLPSGHKASEWDVDVGTTYTDMMGQLMMHAPSQFTPEYFSKAGLKMITPAIMRQRTVGPTKIVKTIGKKKDLAAERRNLKFQYNPHYALYGHKGTFRHRKAKGGSCLSHRSSLRKGMFT